MTDNEARGRGRAAVAKLILIIALVGLTGYLLVGLLSGTFDGVQLR